MKNMVDYARQELRLLEELPFRDMDAVILSWLSYLDLSAVPEYRQQGWVTLRELYRAELFRPMMAGMHYQEKTVSLLSAVCASPRYRSAKVKYFQEALNNQGDEPIQFSAITVVFPSGEIALAFRGTDAHAAGWKEDFELALDRSIPAQRLAGLYLEQVASQETGPVYLCGHSKGGNLASYAAANCCEKTRQRIVDVYSFDGPGFLPSEITMDGFSLMESRMHKYIPQGSMVGAMMEPEGDVTIVHSNALGILQHDPFSWETGDDGFVARKKMSPDAKLVNKRLNSWLYSLTEEEKHMFVHGIADVLDSKDTDNLFDWGNGTIETIVNITRFIAKLDKDTARMMLRMLSSFLGGDVLEEKARSVVESVQEACQSVLNGILAAAQLKKENRKENPETETR